MTGARSPRHPLLPLALRLAAIAALAVMSMFVKLVSEAGVHLVEILFWRQAIGVPLILGWLAMRGQLALVRTQRPKAHAVRGAYGLIGMVCNFSAIALLPLAEALTLSFTAPIFAVILSTVLLREKVGIWRWSAVVLGFVGVTIITQPGGGHLPLLGALVGLGGAVMIALISVQIADLSRTERPLTIVLWFAGLTSVGLAIPALVFGQAHDGRVWLYLLAMGVTGSIGQLLLTASLSFGKVASVIVMDYSALMWATLLGWLVWSELPPVTTWLGAPLVVAAGVLIAWREQRLHKQRAEPIGPDPV